MTVAAFRPLNNRALINGIAAVGLPIAKAGHMLNFFGRILASVPIAVRSYQKEFLRILADITWGNGSLVVGGGTVGVVVVLGATGGALTGFEGYNALNLLGLGSATGLLSSFAATRELAPVMLALGFVTQAGCRFTAQLGAMRINEEIDALESMAIRPIPYLAATRVIASVVAAIPMFLACLAVAYMSSELAVWLVSDLSPGTYSHYFSMFVSGTDVMYATIKAAVFVFVSSTLQCYFGYFASGGPAGVGVAAGHAMRAAITVVIVLNMLLTMGLWGLSAGARFGG
jgi:phospholipid/cholesterol/gamma-HCH transport system permease protein